MISPRIIQGGMGAGISQWQLARAVSSTGQLGVVSGTALDQILIRRLQDGDPGGHMRQGLDAFPVAVIAQQVWERFYVAGGKDPMAPYKLAPANAKGNAPEWVALCIVSNFVEVFLARQGHANPVGINYLEKIQAPLLPSIYGAMLAGVEYVIIGAGIPLKIPGVLDLFVNHQPASYQLNVTGALDADDTTVHFNPRDFIPQQEAPLIRPRFLPIVSSNTLASTLLKKANGRVDGLVVEMQSAGGHNAPPRGKMQLTEAGEPIYGERDAVDIAKLRDLGVPFWLAGGYGRPGKLREALDLGAAGIQVGTAFEFASESGLRDDYKAALLARVLAGTSEVFTDPAASPTGFPFKVACLEGTCSQAEVVAQRPRICDLGFLREAFRSADGSIGYRCAAEPLTLYAAKGGQLEDTVGRKCICNGLMANIGLAQIRGAGRVEQGLITAGDDLDLIDEFLQPGASTYNAADVISTLLIGVQ